MSTTDQIPSRVEDFIATLLPGGVERRSDQRTPCSLPVALYLPSLPFPQPALMRDISRQGIGLLHDMPLPIGTLTVRINVPNADITLCACVKLTWCEYAARFGYLSGGRFVRVFTEDPLDELSPLTRTP